MRVVAILASLACVNLCAAASVADPTSTLRVTGRSVIQVRPDRVEVDLGVVTRAEDTRSAVSQNTDAVAHVLAALRPTRADLRTLAYTVTPEYRQPRNGVPEISGYTARNVVRATLDDVAQIGALLDAASRAGANQVQGINFTLRDPLAARQQALRQAAQAARSDADTLAAALGLRIVRVLSVDDGGGGPDPIRSMPMMMARSMAGADAASAVPVESGNIEIRADVSLQAEVAPAKP